MTLGCPSGGGRDRSRRRGIAGGDGNTHWDPGGEAWVLVGVRDRAREAGSEHFSPAQQRASTSASLRRRLGSEAGAGETRQGRADVLPPLKPPPPTPSHPP